MSNILAAEATASGKVKIEGFELEQAFILSLGKQASNGVALIQGDKVFYITSSATDIKTTIEKLASITTKVANVLTAIGGGMTGPTTAPPPSLPTTVAELNTLVSELNQLKDALK